MVIVPDSNIILLDCPLKLDDRNQITFDSITAQYNYFSSLPKLQNEDATYQRKDGVIRFPTHTEINDELPTFEDLLKYDYCMYQNNSYDNKWFYAYITNIKYINDGMSEISIETDTYQTWQFDLVFKDSFIEREHVADDSVGLHTIPEGLATGDYISCDLQPSFNVDLETCFVISASELLTGVSGYSTLNQKIPMGLYYIGVENDVDVEQYIKAYDKAGKGDAINSIFVAPSGFFSSWQSNQSVTVDGTTFSFSGKISYNVTFEVTQTTQITKVNYLADQYYPKNNKLLVYPYSFLQVSNHNGTVVNYRWEEFNQLLGGSNYEFMLRGTISPGCSFSCYPIDYKNILNNFDEAITLGKYPIGSWTSDVYTNWLTQNGVNILGHQFTATEARIGSSALLGASGLIDVAKGAKTGNNDLIAESVSDVSSGVIGIYNAIQDDYRHSLIPDQALGNTNVGDYSFQFGLTNLEFKRISIKREYATILDNFFSAYGYKVNRFGLPQISSRSNWNYIKTNDINLLGEIPDVDRKKLESIFNKGCTFWHTTTYFLDYNRTNSIVS